MIIVKTEAEEKNWKQVRLEDIKLGTTFITNAGIFLRTRAGVVCLTDADLWWCVDDNIVYIKEYCDVEIKVINKRKEP